MALSINEVTLVGHVGQDPEAKTFDSGDTLVNIRMATNERWTDRSGEKQERTEWHTVVVRGKSAQAAAQYIDKGDHIYVRGSIRTRKWEDKEGNERYSTEINAFQWQFVGGRSQGDEGGRERSQGSNGGSSQDEGRRAKEREYDDSDLPF